MVNTQLLDYVKQQLSQGLSMETIQHNLESAGGWNLVDINEVFAALGVNQPVHVGTDSTSPVTIKYAGFWIRFVAVTVDSFIVGVAGSLIQLPLTLSRVNSTINSQGMIDLAHQSQPSSMYQVLSVILSLCVSWGYFSLMTYYNGATLGKMLVGIQVKADNFGKLSFGKVLIRETVSKFISGIILGIGYIIAGVTQKKQALHDKFAHSVVVYKDPSKPHTAGLIVGIIIACIIPVLAILGILSSVVLVSLSSARQKGNDIRTMSVLSQLRTEAEVYYGNNKNTYTVTRSCSNGMFVDPLFTPVFAQLKDKSIVTCYAEGQTYAISATLSSDTLNESAHNYCVDSTGYSKPGIATDDGSTASCKIMSPAAPDNSVSSVTSNLNYSYTLPSGWQKVPSDIGQNVEAANVVNKYAFSVSAKPLSPDVMYATSIVNVINVATIKGAIQSQNKSTVIESVAQTTVGGEVAFVSKFNLTVSSPSTAAQTQTIRQALVQYNMFHKGMAYTLVFILPYGAGSGADSDIQSIISSFKFN